MYCSKCGIEISDNANFCAKCGAGTKKKKSETSQGGKNNYGKAAKHVPSPYDDRTKRITKRFFIGFGVFCVFWIAVIAITLTLGTPNSNHNYNPKSSNKFEESCYDLGRRYGRCSSAAMLGGHCDSADDIIIPERCRNRSDTESGIAKGVMESTK